MYNVSKIKGQNACNCPHIKIIYNLSRKVRQGTFLGSTSFLLQVNDLKAICDDAKYVDDITLWESCKRSGDDNNLQTAAGQAVERTNKITRN